MNYNTILVNIDEIWMKGRNQRSFIDLLIKHIYHRISANHSADFHYRRENQRIIIESEVPFNQDAIDILTKTPGIQSIDLAIKIPLDYKDVLPTAIKDLESYPNLPKTFKVVCTRANKNFPMKSLEVARDIGGGLLKHFDKHLQAKMNNQELTVKVRILDTNIYVSSQKIFGMGGLPVGSSDRLVCMLSGGFDSPVASYLMAKRGCDQTFIFFYAYPYVGEEVQDKIIELTKVLSKFQRFAPLYIVPFGDIQKKISEKCKASYRTILIRKAMVECTNILAERVGALGILTGDALGQVSSQTMSSICFMDRSTNLPIIRPLIGFNKEEIISLSRKIGTHDISVRPHDDACALFSPKHPATRPSESYRDYYNQEIDIKEDLKIALDNAEVVRIDKFGKTIRNITQKQIFE